MVSCKWRAYSESVCHPTSPKRRDQAGCTCGGCSCSGGTAWALGPTVLLPYSPNNRWKCGVPGTQSSPSPSHTVHPTYFVPHIPACSRPFQAPDSVVRSSSASHRRPLYLTLHFSSAPSVASCTTIQLLPLTELPWSFQWYNVWYPLSMMPKHYEFSVNVSAYDCGT